MATKIYKLCLIRGRTEAYYQLSEEEKQRLWDQVRAAVREAGAQMSTPYYDCRWSNDKYATFFIMEYPDVESAIKDTTAVGKLGLYRYLVGETIMGIERGTGLSA
jgi:UDP-galactopyranose mutase